MLRIEIYILLFLHFILYYTVFLLLATSFMKTVVAIPLINRTNPYYERHLEHINSI